MTVQNLIKTVLFVPAAIIFMIACSDSNKEKDKEKELTSKNPPPEDETKPAKSKRTKTSIGITTIDNKKMVKDKSGVYNRAEVMPTYPGGESALSKYVTDHIDYNSPALENDQQGTVMISFVVDEKGNIENPKVENSTTNSEKLNREAVKVLEEMPDWNPGTIKGKTVKTRMYLPITFRTEE